MDYVKPADVASAMINAGRSKLALSPLDLVIRGGLAGAILAAATSLAITGAVQTNQPLVGALIFPVGLILIVLLGLDLVTGSFGLLPLPLIENDTEAKTISPTGAGSSSAISSAAWSMADCWRSRSPILAPRRRPASPPRSSPSPSQDDGLRSARLRRPRHRVRQSDPVQLDGLPRHRRGHDHYVDIGKIACAYMPVFIFFAQGFEHSVVNMFVIPTGMMMGAKVTVAQWWLWNQIPVTLGNLVGGFIFTGLALYITHKPRVAAPAPLTAPTQVPAE